MAKDPDAEDGSSDAKFRTSGVYLMHLSSPVSPSK